VPNSAKASKLRFSLFELLALVGFIAIGCVALRYASPIWVSVFCSLILLALCVSIYGAIWRAGAQRAYALGFAIAGFLYSLLAFGPGFSETIGSGLPSGIIAENYLYPLLIREIPAKSVAKPNGTPVSSIRNNVTYVNYPFLPYFKQVSHSLGLLFAAALGAAIARWFASTAPVPRNNKE
jgi:hypothetical protein